MISPYVLLDRNLGKAVTAGSNMVSKHRTTLVLQDRALGGLLLLNLDVVKAIFHLMHAG